MSAPLTMIFPVVGSSSLSRFARPSTCRSRSRDQPRCLAAPDPERHAIDRIDDVETREKTSVWIGKCFFRSRTSRSGPPFPPACGESSGGGPPTVADSRASPRGGRHASRRPSGWAVLLERRILRAALVGGEGAAGAGSPWQVGERGHHALISLSRRAARRSGMTSRLGEPRRPACVWPGRSNRSPASPPRPRPAYMTTTRSAFSATTPMSWGSG